MDNTDARLAVDDVISRLGTELARRGLRMGTAESCTGGLVAHSLTNVAGSSAWFEGAVVAYDNRVKRALLGVPDDILRTVGAVSAECVEAMAHGVGHLLDVPVSVAISGIAGPGGGSADKPVGTVWMAWRLHERVWSRRFAFSGDRGDIKFQSMRAAVDELAQVLTKNGAP